MTPSRVLVPFQDMIIADVHDAVCAVDDIETCNVEITLTLRPP